MRGSLVAVVLICREVLLIFGGSIAILDATGPGTVVEIRLLGGCGTGGVTTAELTKRPCAPLTT
jgi:Fe-S cluster biogenesis protein NfuA